MLQDFKKFALKGNVIDLAVGVIIGGAFGKIVTSLVNDLIMPLLGLLTGRINLSDLKWVIIKGVEATSVTKEIKELAILYGAFLQTLLDFLIVSFSIFLVIKLMSKFKKKQEIIAVPIKPTNEEVLLTEIRDILKSQK